MSTLKHILKYALILLLIYFIYCTVSILVYTKIKINQTSADVQKTDVKSMETVLTQAVLNESAGLNSHIENVLPLRCQLVEQAKESLLICQYAISDDDSGMIFVGKLLEAAERGVTIELLVNGLSNQVKGFERLPLSLLSEYPNFKLRMIGGFNFIKPWEMNNVLHDKLIIVDDEYLLSSGGNIENRFTMVSENPRPVHDLDLIIRKNGKASENSLIPQATTYFNQLWENPYAVNLLDKKKNTASHLTDDQLEEKKQAIQTAMKRHKELLSKDVLGQITYHPLESGHLIHNSVGTLVKEPVVWKQLSTLINQSEQKAIIASPYVILTDKMLGYIHVPSHRNIKILSNSVSNSPNLFAFGGYLHQKQKLLETFDIWEFQGQGSLHQKALLLDETVSIIGSSNLDSRSAFLSSEHMLIINSREFHDELETILNDYKEQSLQSLSEKQIDDSVQTNHTSDVSTFKKAVLKIISWLSPLFDFLL